MIITTIIVHAMFWTGVYTTAKKLVIPVMEGTVDAIKQYKKDKATEKETH